MDIEIPVQTLLDEAREIENKVREVFERAQASALPAPTDEPDDDEISMVY
jgi:predicted ATP-grasp superfamily ATP-dependent carboligase